MNKTIAIVIGLMAITIIVLSILLYRAGKEVESTTISVPGDTSFHNPVTTTPKPVQEIKPESHNEPIPPIIIYLKDSSGVISVDTNAIKDRYQEKICELESLITEYETIRLYSDTVNDTSAKVRAVIRDKVQRNRLQDGRSVSFMNTRPIQINMKTVLRKGAWLWGLAGGWNFMGDPLVGANFDYISKQNVMFGVTLGTGFLVNSDRFILLRWSQKF